MLRSPCEHHLPPHGTAAGAGLLHDILSDDACQRRRAVSMEQGSELQARLHPHQPEGWLAHGSASLLILFLIFIFNFHVRFQTCGTSFSRRTARMLASQFSTLCPHARWGSHVHITFLLCSYCLHAFRRTSLQETSVHSSSIYARPMLSPIKRWVRWTWAPAIARPCGSPHFRYP